MLGSSQFSRGDNNEMATVQINNVQEEWHVSIKLIVWKLKCVCFKN